MKGSLCYDLCINVENDLAKNPTSLTCPSCGAPLKVAELQTRVDCQYCHATIELPADKSNPIIIQPPTIPDFQYIKPIGRLIGWLVGFFLFLVIGGIAIVLFTTKSKSVDQTLEGVRIYSIYDLKLLPSNDVQAAKQFVGISYNSDESRKLTMLDFDQEPILRWQATDLGEQSYQSIYTIAGDNVVLVSKTNLSLLRRSDGIKIWETSLSDQLPTSCDSCLVVSENTIFALTQIGVLHAFDLITGQQKWSKSFEKWHEGIAIFDNNPIVVHEIEGVLAIVTYDGTNGQILKKSNPTCPNYIFTDDPQEFEMNSDLIINDKFYYLLYGFWEPGCFEKWNPSTNTMEWQSLLPETLVRSDQHILFSDEWIFIAAERSNQIWKIESKNGNASLFLENENYSIRPVEFQDNILIVQAIRTKGSSRYEIWGYDLTSGDRIWQIIPQAFRSIEVNASSIIDSAGVYDIHLTSNKLILLQAFDDPARITFDQIDLASGVVQKQTSFTLPDQTVFSLSLIGWQDQIAWLDTDEIYGFDSFTGQPIAQWP